MSPRHLFPVYRCLYLLHLHPLYGDSPALLTLLHTPVAHGCDACQSQRADPDQHMRGLDNPVQIAEQQESLVHAKNW